MSVRQVAKRDAEVEICDMICDIRANRRKRRAFCPFLHVRQAPFCLTTVTIFDGPDIATDAQRPEYGMRRRSSVNDGA